VAVYFFDSSALIKRYINETGTAWVQSLTDAASGHEIYIARVTTVEVVAAVTRRARGGGLEVNLATAVIAQFRTDAAQDYRIIELTPAVAGRAMTVAEVYGLCGYDAVQLALALEVYGRLLALGLLDSNFTYTFVSADMDLNAAAAGEGMTAEDPNTHL
jgi:predicted nucleic acid-binding protein